ncbi:MAG: chemotaxis protein CheW [bacterium]
MSSRAPSDVLRARARALAKPVVVESELATTDVLDLLVTIVGDERLAIPVTRVAAIAFATNIVPLPRAVAPVYGVTVWRGRPITVLTLGAGVPSLGDESRFVVLGDHRRAEVAVLVDGVDDAVRVDRASITPVDASSRRAYALGVTEDAMLILDADALIGGRRVETAATLTE